MLPEAERQALLRQRLTVASLASGFSGLRDRYGTTLWVLLAVMGILLAVACAGEFDEFDLNEFFAATGADAGALFKHKSDVQKWLEIIRGAHMPKAVEHLKTGTTPPFSMPR